MWFGRENDENVVWTRDWCGWPSSPLFNKTLNIFFQDLFGTNVVQNCVRSTIFQIPKASNFIKYEAPREFYLRNFQLCGLFVGFLWIFPAQTFPLSVHNLHYTFSLLIHMYTVALSILFSSNAFWIMLKVSLYLESSRSEFLCIKHLKVFLSRVGI